MKLKRGEIRIDGIQVKSLEKAKKLCAALQIIEEECGIHEVKITLSNIFVCPWINLSDLQNTEMEKLVSELFLKLKSNN